MSGARDEPAFVAWPLPRDVETDPRRDAIHRALAADTRRLWSGGTIAVPYLPLTESLRHVLCDPAVGGMLQRGLEAAAATLAAEQRGLQALPRAVADRQGRRVSRLLLVSNDGAERFYRQVEQLVVGHAPRVLACVLDCDSPTLGDLLPGAAGVVKLVLTGHKTAAAAALRALVVP